VYTTDTAPDEVATAPNETEELMLTLNAAANAAAEMPAVAFAPPVGSAPDEVPPDTDSVWLAGDQVTPLGPAGAKTTSTVFVLAVPNW
jgi:streptogramin lyase